MAITNKEKDEFNKKFFELCEYIEKNIMGYDDNQRLSRYMCLRLRGLSQGKYMGNNNTDNYAKYPYDVILATFIYSSSDIQRAIKNVCFTDEKHKFNYVLRIVEDNLNDVYMRMKRTKKNNKEVETMKMEVAENSNLSSIYNKKKAEEGRRVEKKNNKLNDLW